jgi:hypothetical protein
LKVLHVVPRVTKIQLADEKDTKQAGDNNGILLLPHPVASHYAVLPPLMPPLEQRQLWQSWHGGLWWRQW